MESAGLGREHTEVRWASQPHPRRPVLLAAFEGWNDAGDAATSAVAFLHEHWGARAFADIDPEGFYDFTATRPRVEFDEHLDRQIVWPANEFSVAQIDDPGRDVILLRGVEPQLRWRTFCEAVLTTARALDVELVVTLGALLAEVAHTRPTPVFGAAYEASIADELGLTPSRYEGPTGIVGVLHAACRDAGMRSAALWAAVPSYVPGAPSPKATLALVERTATLVGTTVETDELAGATIHYEEQVSELVSEDEETTEYVRALEQRQDEGGDSIAAGTSLVEEVERFLRDQRD